VASGHLDAPGTPDGVCESGEGWGCIGEIASKAGVSTSFLLSMFCSSFINTMINRRTFI